MPPTIAFDHVSCAKPSNGASAQILKDISFQVEPNEFIVILGSSGAGKSTLLRLLVLLDAYQSGAIMADGKELRDWNVRSLRQTIGFVQQLPHLFLETVLDNVLYAPRLRNEAMANENEIAAAYLDKVGLSPSLATRAIHELSVGQQMRVSLARALANRPRALLLDEPTAALDPSSKRQIVQLIQRLHQEDGLTALFVMHDMELAIELGARGLFLHEGRLLADAPVLEWGAIDDCAPLQDFLAGRLR